ncbi:alanine racemase [Mediannikoviicoccus vaginalis]|uniref:alanine racemase n=1 Tax=Mediannikoviicoccus vaginalis TaxID=2899727 RepID=UPI001F00D99A|nr:alanine racemase [Mediannikoviicoccus vaginalis]
MEKYQNYLKIDLDRLVHNFKSLQAIAKPSKVAGVVKANAYGLGSITIAREIEKEGADYLCVANMAEAMELRKSRIYLPILVLGYIKDDMFRDVIQNRIDITAYDYNQCFKLNEEAKALNAVVDVHIKIDTGMGRLGFLIDETNIEESIREIKKINSLSNVRIKGIYSHLSDADGEDFSYTQMQYEKFMEFIMFLDQEGITIPLKHISNDAGAILHGYYLDMIRCGLGLYGYYGSNVVRECNAVDLKPAVSFYTSVASVKTFQPGEQIGYNRTYTTDKVTKIAAVSLGYADGYPTALSNKGYMIINGQRADVIGKVCMDQTMLDVTHIEDVAIGDEVLVFGEKEESIIPLEEVAELANTITYDILCRISLRIPRAYYRDGKLVKVIDYLEKIKIDL